MARLNQPQLLQRTYDLTTNGLRADIQVIIGPLGYNAAGLAVGTGYADAIALGKSQTRDMKSKQTSITRAEKATRLAAQTLVTEFADTARILFKDDPDTLLALGLQTQYETLPPEGEGDPVKVAARPSRGAAESILRWRTMFLNATLLTGTPQTTLASVNWTADRITAGLDAVEAYSNADIAQQAAISDYQARSAKLQEDVETLRQWYSKASTLCKVALKAADPQNKNQWLEALGLV